MKISISKEEMFLHREVKKIYHKMMQGEMTIAQAEKELTFLETELRVKCEKIAERGEMTIEGSRFRIYS